MKVHDVSPHRDGVQVTVFDEETGMYTAAIGPSEAEAAIAAAAQAERYALSSPWRRVASLGRQHEIGGIPLTVIKVDDREKTVELALIGGPRHRELYPQEQVDPMR